MTHYIDRYILGAILGLNELELDEAYDSYGQALLAVYFTVLANYLAEKGIAEAEVTEYINDGKSLLESSIALPEGTPTTESILNLTVSALGSKYKKIDELLTGEFETILDKALDTYKEGIYLQAKELSPETKAELNSYLETREKEAGQEYDQMQSEYNQIYNLTEEELKKRGTITNTNQVLQNDIQSSTVNHLQSTVNDITSSPSIDNNYLKPLDSYPNP